MVDEKKIRIALNVNRKDEITLKNRRYDLAPTK